MSDKEKFSQTFGYSKVTLQERAEKIRRVFSEIHDQYDLMNDLLSLGTHRHWKKYLVQAMQPQSEEIIVDLAGGTGDIARKLIGEGRKIIIVDPSQHMLNHAQKKMMDSVTYICAPGENMPFPDNTIDKLCISFGIRNAVDINAMLKEIYRVLKPGGKFFCLEFSKIHPIIRPFYDLFSFTLIPALATLITKNKKAYQYLIESIRVFYSQEQFTEVIESNGFDQVGFKNIYFGMIALHQARKTPLSRLHSI